MAFSAVEDNTMILGSLHQVQEVLIMLLRDTVKYAYNIMNYDNAG